MSALTRHKGTAKLVWLVAALADLSVLGQVTNNSAAQAQESARVPLIRMESEEVSGDAAGKDIFVQLPEHVRFQAGSELGLALYPSLEVLSRLCTIEVSINGKPLSGATVEGKSLNTATDLVIRLRFSLAEGSLTRGWNRVSLRFVLNKPASDSGGAKGPGTWTLRRADSYLKVVYQRMTLFPELVRFPGSLAEEKLLHPPDGDVDSAGPTLALLVPTSRRDVHLRACAVIGARLGQLGYLSAEDCRIAWIENWSAESLDRNGIALGVRDELSSMELPANIADELASLTAEQGLIAEFIPAGAANQRRWLLVAGADDAGLEKAVLTLGSAAALAAAPPNPVRIDAMPAVSSELEAKTQPETRRVALKDLGVGEVRLSGIHTMAQAVSGWRLPPGFEIAAGVLDLRFSHSTTLLSPGSWLDVMVDGIKAGTVQLTPKTAAGGSARLNLPKGFGGRDPMIFTFRAHLDVASVECNRRPEDEPWLLLSGDSTVEIAPSPIQVRGLSRFDRLFLRDNFLRRAAFVVPRDFSLEELRWLVGVSMHLGQQLPSSPVLWPEVCSYSKSSPPPPARLQDRSILLLGSIGQWAEALPQDAPILLKIIDGRGGAVRMHGYEVNIAAFEPSLVFVQMMSSPWSRGEWLVAAGGWHEFATTALSRLLTDSKITAELYGNVCAMDAGGRVAVYDSRRPSRDSLAERIRSRIPLGLSVEETRGRVNAEMAHLRRHGSINSVIFYISAVVFALIIGFRVLLMWERTYLQKRTGPDEPHPIPGAS